MSTSTGGLFPLPLYTMPIYSVTAWAGSAMWVFCNDLKLSGPNTRCIYCSYIYSSHAVVPDAAMATHYHLKTIEKTPTT